MKNGVFAQLIADRAKQGGRIKFTMANAPSRFMGDKCTGGKALCEETCDFQYTDDPVRYMRSLFCFTSMMWV